MFSCVCVCMCVAVFVCLCVCVGVFVCVSSTRPIGLSRVPIGEEESELLFICFQ